MTNKILKKIEEKFKNLTIKQKILFFIYIIIIYLVLFFLYTSETKQIIEYSAVGVDYTCKEVYINGKLQGNPCPDFFKKKEDNSTKNIFNVSKLNFS